MARKERRRVGRKLGDSMYKPLAENLLAGFMAWRLGIGLDHCMRTYVRGNPDVNLSGWLEIAEGISKGVLDGIDKNQKARQS